MHRQGIVNKCKDHWCTWHVILVAEDSAPVLCAALWVIIFFQGLFPCEPNQDSCNDIAAKMLTSLPSSYCCKDPYIVGVCDVTPNNDLAAGLTYSSSWFCCGSQGWWWLQRQELPGSPETAAWCAGTVAERCGMCCAVVVAAAAQAGQGAHMIS